MKCPLTSRRIHSHHHYWAWYRQTRVGCESGDCGDSRRIGDRGGVRMRKRCLRDGDGDDGLTSDGGDWSHAVSVCVCVCVCAKSSRTQKFRANVDGGVP